MDKFGLTTKLNIKTIIVVSIFMFALMAYSLVQALNERKADYAEHLSDITAFIAQKMTDRALGAIGNQGGGGKEPQAQVMDVNKEVQHIIDNLFVPDSAIKYGVFSRYHQRIVAIGPDFDQSLLAHFDLQKFNAMYETNQPVQGESSSSLIWYGAPMLYHLRPLSHDGQVVGHAFAGVNLNRVYNDFRKRALNFLIAGFIALLFVIMLFQEMFIKLKKDLGLFANAITSGQAKQFESEIPELTPVLHYIREQTENIARLDRLNLIGEMAASIGHEVRNPMTTVRGFLQLMAEKKEFVAGKDYFAIMIEELDRANNIITEYLALAKNKVMDFHAADLNSIISEVAPLLQADVIRHNCQLQMNLGAIPDILLDAGSIRQLILNMVRNAIEAMPQGGAVKISTTDSGGKVLLSIADEGSGISGELLARLGTPFVTTKEKGVGLGLAVCYRIIHRHGATIDVQSEPGQGTTFTVTFLPSPEKDQPARWQE
jgi:signal transduction histidine kinase